MSPTADLRPVGVPTVVDRTVTRRAPIGDQVMECTVLSMVSLNYHHSRIRHCDERRSVPAWFDDTHPSVPAATMVCCAATGDPLRGESLEADVNLLLSEP